MKNYLSLLAMALPVFMSAQANTADTVILDLAKTSRIVFTMQDSNDLELLREYDYQAMFGDIFDHLEGSKRNEGNEINEWNERNEINEINERNERNEINERNEKNERNERNEKNEINESYGKNESYGDGRSERSKADSRHHRWMNYGDKGKVTYHYSRHLVNFDIGTNNYLQDDGFPDEEDAIYSVRPWGSWNIAINSVLRTPIGDRFYVDWGAGVSWYNFKFLNERTVVDKDNTGVFFYEDERNLDYVKSKLSIAYVNASVVPTISLGPEHRRHRLWNCHHHDLRLGIGGYVGYRIESHYKLVHQVDGEYINEKDRDNFYLNNLRYGVRLQLGIHATDFYFNYDLNELFSEGKGPELHPISFGIVF